eukprot:TRINITY_DN2693_c0_g1_i1.p1 TRINITY_DN2693_c0_g1~~TRINITY_DN2693_c0_g1_i1.p1  ORF type:complete len:253 (+),score=79.34 TRINITY_DN2693_c0_g1_i1:165-923(+)
MSVPRLGQKLSLISKSSIKYEGTLADINAGENTLTLSNVTMFGTEDRPAATFVPKADTLFEFIVFRGNDIKDLTVYNDASLPPVDPAIVSAGPPRQQKQQPQHHQAPSHVYHSSPPAYKERVTAVPDYRQQRYNNHGGGGYRQQGRGGGGYGNRRRGGKGYNSSTGLEFASASGKKEEMKEFDFEAMQKQVAAFEKEKSQKVSPAYKKETGFFDTLSKDDGARGPRGGYDAETFGEGARGRGGFRGGRGRGR